MTTANTYLRGLTELARVAATATSQAEVFASGMKALQGLDLRPALLLLVDGRLRVDSLGVDPLLVNQVTEMLGIKVNEIELALVGSKTHDRVLRDLETVFVEDVCELVDAIATPSTREAIGAAIRLLGYEKLLLMPIVVDGAATGVLAVARAEVSETDQLTLELFAQQMSVVAASRFRGTRPRRRTTGQLDAVATQRLEAMSRLAGGVAHDFNNLLTVILSTAFLLQSEMEEQSEQAEDIDTIVTAAKSAATLTRQLLDFARQRSRFHTTFDANERLVRLESGLLKLLGGHVKLEVQAAAKEALIHADPAQFDQIVTTMVSNARDAMPQGGTLSLALSLGIDENASHIVELIVQDTGNGMDEETQRRVFEPFYTTKPRSRGTGLGMATVYGIVTGLGGTIEIESQLGKGTAVFVRLPFSEKSATVERQSKRLEGGRILVIEDQNDVRRAVKRTLEVEGFEVEDYETGEAGFTAYLERPGEFTAIVCDVQLPGESGSVIAGRILERDPKAAILLISGHLGDHAPDPSSKVAALPFLWKPFSPDELVRAVNACVGATSS